MKTIFLSCFFTLLTLAIFAQKKIKVEEKNDGGNKALVVTIYEASKSDVEKAWKSRMKKLGAKVSMKNEIFADDAKMKALGDNTIDIYARVNKTSDESVELTVKVDLGGAYLSSSQHGSQFKAMKDFVHDFAIETTKEAIAGQLKEANKVLEGQEKELVKLVKENEKLHKNIEQWKEDIKDAEEDIKQNDKDQVKKKEEIELQKKSVVAIEAKEKAVN